MPHNQPQKAERLLDQLLQGRSPPDSKEAVRVPQIIIENLTIAGGGVLQLIIGGSGAGTPVPAKE